MADLAVIFLTSFAIGFTGAVMPGPLLALTLKESLQRGKFAALWLSSGHSFCELLVVGALVAGSSRLVSVDKVVGPVGLLGGFTLIWMGFAAFRRAGAAMNAFDDSPPASKAHNLLVGGAAVTISNPYWLLWWLTVGTALVLSAAKAGAAGVASFYIGHISSDFLWFGLVGGIAGWRRQMLGGKLYRRVIQACAACLVLFGSIFAGYGGRVIHAAMVN